MSEIRIREAREADAKPMLQYLRRLDQEDLGVLFSSDRQWQFAADQALWIRGLLEAETSNLWIAEAEGRIAGTLDFHGHQHPQLAHGGELGMSVDRSFRKRGVGRALLSTLFDWVAAHETLRRIELQVFENNEGAIKLYLATGFVEEGRKRSAVRVGDDLLDIVLMAKLL